MNLSPAPPHSPIRTPQQGSSTKNLQLTPIWQEVVKNHRLPPGISHDLIFKEISNRLEDFEWPVRQHAFRVLCDIIPIISSNRLDEEIIANNIFNKIIINLGHAAPGIRKVALETLLKYLKKTGQPEKMLENFIHCGVREMDLVNNDRVGILRENITLGTIVSLVEVLKPFIMPENGGYSISQSFLIKIVEALTSKVKNPTYKDKCLETLWKLKNMVGDYRFQQSLKNNPEREYLMDVMNIRDELIRPPPLKTWKKEANVESFLISGESDSFDFDYSPPRLEGSKEEKESSEDYSDGTDTETYTKEPAPNDLDDPIFFHLNRTEAPTYTPPSFVAIDNESFCPEVEKNKESEGSKPSSPRVVLEAEIQFAENKAITMKVMEDEKKSQPKNNQVDVETNSEKRFITEDGELIMKVLPNNEEIVAEEEDKTRTPRRVRFGGEVIKLRTPDSDTTDITIEIHEAEDDSSVKKEPIREYITIKQEKPKQETKPEKPVTPTQAPKPIPPPPPPPPPPSQIPLPVAPATKPPGRDPSPSRKPGNEPVKPAQLCLSPKSESFDSAPSSSGSDTDTKDKWSGVDEDSFWLWAELKLVEDNLLKDLQNLENWKIQYQALEQLKVILISPKTIEKIEKPKNHDKLHSLLKCLLHKLPQTNNQQVTALALSIVTQLVETLSKDVILLFVEDIVRGLCKYVGGCKNLNLKIESVQSLKTLFGVLEPSRIIDVLIGDGCLFSSSSKLRENSLLAIMYAMMTFPSDYFDMNKILEKVADATADTRRRVRHASLEAIAILSQFCSSKLLTDNIGRVAERLPTATARAQLIAAVQARLSRRLLPTISSEGLVLYALQIPASRRFGNLGSPMGADVDWILSGTGSVSTGSAKSKGQLNAAQRLDVKQTTPLSPSKWAQSDRTTNTTTVATNNKTPPGQNPWTIQKHRNESNVDNTKNPGNRFYKSPSAGNINIPEIVKSTENYIAENPKDIFNEIVEVEKGFRPEDITWALVPVSALEEPHLGRERSNSLWGESTMESPQFLPTSFGPLRPLYLKLQPTHEQFLLSKSSDDVRRNSYSYGLRKGQEKLNQEDFTEIRLLTPTILREKTSADPYYQNTKPSKNEVRSSGETTTRIPVLNSRNVQRVPRSTTTYNDRKIADGEENQKVNSNNPNGFTGTTSVFLPSIHQGQNDNNYVQKSPTANKYGEVDEIKLQDTMTQLSGLLTASKEVNKSANRDFYQPKNQPPEIDSIPSRNDFIEPEMILEEKLQNKLFDRSYIKNHEPLPNAVASAPAVISSEGRGQTPSTSSSNSTDFGTLSGSEMRLRRLNNGSGALENGIPYRNYNTYNPKLKGRKISFNKNPNKVGINGNPFPDTLKPFDRPKEGLDTCFNQLESQQWEVNMLGLTSLVRLLRHHPAIVLSQLHPIIVALGRQIRNLRSQVARAACQASAEMFVTLKRNVESDLDELSGPLFHRSADTNRFIRADCNHALDNMADSVGHAKAVSVIISKGTTHQNATVRAVAARLLLRLSEKVGPEKLLSLPKEIRDKMLQAGANLLMEGKLETRAFAKQVFRVWSSHPSFSSLILEAVQPNVMRHISKTLISLKS